MKVSEILLAWRQILTGRRPSLSIEITRECPLRCPGCYAYGDQHLGEGAPNLRTLADFKGDELVRRVLDVVEDYKPLHLSIVGGDPLVRYREVDQLLPEITRRGVHVQLVTSAFREVPVRWSKLPKVSIVVSIDGLPAEHDLRRRPATYDRILQSLAGHQNSISVHCTITSQMMQRAGYLKDFLEFWSARPETRRIWFSLFTPQIGETSVEIVPTAMRHKVVETLLELRQQYPKLDMAPAAIRAFVAPPASPAHCTFARTTYTVSADLVSRVTPCQFGGNPDCSQCGCVASVGLHAIYGYKLFGFVQVGKIFDLSQAIGEYLHPERIRHKKTDPIPFPILSNTAEPPRKSAALGRE